MMHYANDGPECGSGDHHNPRPPVSAVLNSMAHVWPDVARWLRLVSMRQWKRGIPKLLSWRNVLMFLDRR
jgi:hypothetical protein